MDFLFELLFEVVLEGIFHVTIGNPKVKNWVKTLLFSLFAQGIAVWIACMALFGEAVSDTGRYVLLGLAAVWSAGTLIGAVFGHRRQWKQW